MLRHAACLVLAALCAGRLDAQRGPDTVFVVNSSHLDIGFTAPPFEVRAQRVRILDEAIAAARADPAFRWLEEEGWGADAWWQAHRSDSAALREVRRLLATGRLGIGATWLSPHGAAMPETLPFLMAHLALLQQRFGYRPAVAVINDVPAIPEALVETIARAGVRYLLLGPNPSYMRGFPARLARTPFWWQTAHGERVLVYLDPDGYTAGPSRWGLDPECASYFNAGRFPPGEGPLATMRRGLDAMRDSVDRRYDAVLVQQSLDNWDVECARRLVGHAAAWNRAGHRPVVVLAQPEAYFRHIEARYGPTLPVLRGEWGGVWDVMRANAPVWTWRLRQAARALGPAAPAELRLAIATATDHNLQLGRPWDGHDPAWYEAHAAQNASLFRAAVEGALGAAGARSVPPAVAVPTSWTPDTAWGRVLAHSQADAIRLRFAARGAFPSDPGGAPLPEARLSAGADGRRIAVRVRLDRSRLHDGVVTLQIPLRVPPGGVRVAPVGSPDAVAGRWLLGAPPDPVIAPLGLLVLGYGRQVRVRSPLVFAWSLRSDPADPSVAWLSGLVAWQSVFCRFADGTEGELPFALFYPGEPALLDVGVEMELMP
jgi:hypothetical protein